MPKEATFSITNNTKGKLVGLPFAQMKNVMLGISYSLELIFATPSFSQALNLKYRKKNKPANVLSFPLSGKEGQIIITPAQARKEARLYHQTYQNFVGYLFIHGLLHLKGFSHGSTMEDEERRFCALFLGFNPHSTTPHGKKNIRRN